jgi:broad specificity phosphatase PhoE
VEDYPIDRILSSPTLRSQQTVQPLADDRFLEIEPLAALGMDAGPTQLRALFWDRGCTMWCSAPMVRRQPPPAAGAGGSREHLAR